MDILDLFFSNINDFILTTDSVHLEPYGHVLAPLADEQGKLSIAMDDVPEDSNPMIIEGRMSLWGTERKVRAIFYTSDIKIEAFYIVVSLPGNWDMASLLAKIPQSEEMKAATAFFEKTTFKNVHLFVAGNMSRINDKVLGRDGLVVGPGLNLVADSMNLAYDKLGSEWLGKWTNEILGEKIEEAKIRGTLNLHHQVPNLLLSFEKDHHPLDLGAFHISSWSVIKGLSLSKQGLVIQDELILSLQCDIGDLKNISIAGSFDKAGQLNLDGIFHEPLTLDKGINTLASLASMGEDVNIEAQLPSFGNQTPIIGLHELKLGFNTQTKEVNEVVAILEVVDSTTGRTMTWDVVETPKLGIEAPKVGIHLSKANQWKPQVDIFGKAIIHDWLFEVSYQQGSSIQAHFAQQGNTDLASFAESAFGGIPFPHLNLKVTDASYTYLFGTKRHVFGFELQGKFDPGGHGIFILEDINLQVSKDSNGSSQFVLGQFALGGAHLSVQAAHQSDGTWELEGRSKAGEEIKITNLFTRLLGHFGATVPHELPDISLSDVELAYNSAEKSVHIAGNSQWEIPEDIPFGGSTETLQVAIVSAKDTTGVRATEVQLSWMHKPKDSEESFFITASYSKDTGPAFFMHWKGEEAHTIGLKDLFELTDIESLLGFKPFEEIAKFELSELFMGFTLHPLSLDLGAVWKWTNDVRESTMILVEASFTRDGVDDTFSLSITNGSEKDKGLDLWDLTDALELTSPTDQVSPLIVDEELKIFSRNIFTFDTVRVEYEKHGQRRFVKGEAEATDNFFEEIFFAAEKASGSRDMVIGARFADKSLLDIPGTQPISSQLKAFEDIVKFKPLYVISSTMSDKTKYIPPGMIPAEVLELSDDYADQHDLSAEELLLQERKQKRMLLANALQIAGEITFGNSKDPVMQTLSKAIDLDGIIGQFIIKKEPHSHTYTIELRGFLPGRVSFSAGTNQFILRDGSLSISLDRKDITVGISGFIDLVVGHVHHSFYVELKVNKHGIYGLTHVENGPPLKQPSIFPGVVLSNNYDLELGLQFEPEGVDLGFMVDFHVLDMSHQGSASVVLEMIEEIPDLQYAAFGMSELNLLVMFEAYTGLGQWMDQAADAAHLVNKVNAYISDGKDPVGFLSHYTEKGLRSLHKQYKALEDIFNKIEFKDVSMHYAQSPIVIPDGTLVQPGEGFEGFMDMFGFTIYGKFEFQPGNGTSAFQAKAQMDPIDLEGVLRITGDGEEIKRKQDSWQPGKQIRPEGKTGGEAYPTSEEVLIKAGGPVIEIDSGLIKEVNGKPSAHFHLGFDLELFQVAHTHVSAEMGDEGFKFKFQASAGKVANLDLDCSLDGLVGFGDLANIDKLKKLTFHAGGTFGMHLDIDIDMPKILGVDLPSFHLDTGFDGHLEITVSAEKIMLLINGDFEFEGTRLDLPEIEITSDDAFSDLKELAERIENQILKHAKDLFEDFFAGVGHFIQKGLDEVENIGREAADKAEEIGRKAAEKGEQLAKEAGEEAKKVGEDIAESARVLGDAADQLTKDVAGQVGEIGKEAEKAAKKLGEEGEKALHAAEDVAEKIGEAVAEEVAEIAEQVDAILGPAFEEAEKTLQAATAVANAAIDAAEKAAKKIFDGAKKVADGIKDAAEKVWDEAKKLEKAFEDGLKEAGKGIKKGLNKAKFW